MARTYILALTASSAATVLGLAGVHHVRAPAHLRRALTEHHVLSAATSGVIARGVFVLEAGLGAAVAVTSSVLLFSGGDPSLAIVPLAAAGCLGIVFLMYLWVLRSRRFVGDCGCTGFNAPVSLFSYIPGGVLLASGMLGVALLAWSGLPTHRPAGQLVAGVVQGCALGFASHLVPSTIPRETTELEPAA